MTWVMPSRTQKRAMAKLSPREAAPSSTAGKYSDAGLAWNVQRVRKVALHLTDRLSVGQPRQDQSGPRDRLLIDAGDTHNCPGTSASSDLDLP
jgi:hypothetical protein